MTRPVCLDFYDHKFNKFSFVDGRKQFHCKKCGAPFKPLRLPRRISVGSWLIEFNGLLNDGDRIYWGRGETDLIVANPGNLNFVEEAVHEPQTTG